MEPLLVGALLIAGQLFLSLRPHGAQEMTHRCDEGMYAECGTSFVSGMLLAFGVLARCFRCY